MRLLPSAHVDTFSRDRLPPTDQWPNLRFDLPELQYPERLNAAVELLDRSAARYGADRRCLITPTGYWTYGDLIVRSNQVARVLTDDLGVVPGNRVLLRGPNNPWLVACWFAVLRAGGVAVTTMPMLRETELRTIGEIAQVDLALCDHRFVADLAAANIAPLVGFGGDGVDDLVHRAERKEPKFDAVETSQDDVALFGFTSGTTGRPKATMHFHRDLLAICDTLSAHIVRPTPDDVFSGSPPLGFTFGLGGLVTFPLRAGAASLLLEKGTPDVLLPAVAEHGATVMFTAPTAYRAMLDDAGSFDLRALRACVSAGEHLPKATWSAFHEATGKKIIDMIGATEMLHAFIAAAGDDIRPGATGRAVPGYLAAVLDADGKPAPDGEIGRLAVQGPTGCRYLADPRQTQYVQDGWNVTGDTYLRDEDGYFWYQARSDDMIISAGYNIAGPEVEQAIMTHPDVLECGVVGLADADRTMAVSAFVVLRPGTVGDEAKIQELREHCKRQIAPYKCPRRIEFLAALPRTTTGKVQRYVLRQQS